MRSLLFIPGDSPNKLDKGMGSGADVLLADVDKALKEGRLDAASASVTELEKVKSGLSSIYQTKVDNLRKQVDDLKKAAKGVETAPATAPK